MHEEALRILILEDVPMDAELVEYELERARIPFASRRVDSREEFLRELEDFHPDLILSDYTLPRFDGMTALSLARERAPSIPFLIVTGSVNEETAVGCMKAGATDYLLKSNLARIGPAIQAALERGRAHAQKTQAEAALAASERRFRSLVQNSSDLVTILAPDGTILYASDSAERIVGYSPGDLVGSSLLSYVDGEDVRTVRGLLQNGNGKSNGAGPVEFSLRRVDGSPVWLEAVGTNLLNDATIRGIVLNARDVSERKRADRALRESEERYRDLFDNASDLVCMAAPDGSLCTSIRPGRTAPATEKLRSAACNCSTCCTRTAALGMRKWPGAFFRATGSTMSSWSSYPRPVPRSPSRVTSAAPSRTGNLR